MEVNQEENNDDDNNIDNDDDDDKEDEEDEEDEDEEEDNNDDSFKAISDLLETYDKLLDDECDDYCYCAAKWKEFKNLEVRVVRDMGRKIFQKAFSGCDDKILKILIERLSELTVKIDPKESEELDRVKKK